MGKNLPARMYKRVRKSGVYYYYFTGRANGRKEIPLGSDYIDALRKYIELEQEVEQKFKCPTFIDAADRYLVKVLPTKAPRTQQDNIKELAKLKEFFGNPPAPLDQIKPIHIRKYLDHRTKSGTGMTRANREKALFSHIFNMARQWGLTDAPNPCLGVKGFSEKSRKVYVEDDMFDTVYNAACVPVQEAMMLAYLTGQRPADVIKMTLADVKDNCLYVEQNKTGQKVAIELSGELAALIQKIKQRRIGLKVVSTQLIVNETGRALSQRALQDRFRKLRLKLDIPLEAFQFRDLRAKAGTDKHATEGLEQAKAQLGHKNTRTTEIYVRGRKADKVRPTK